MALQPGTGNLELLQSRGGSADLHQMNPTPVFVEVTGRQLETFSIVESVLKGVDAGIACLKRTVEKPSQSHNLAAPERTECPHRQIAEF
jgi:hypothetical protein